MYVLWITSPLTLIIKYNKVKSFTWVVFLKPWEHPFQQQAICTEDLPSPWFPGHFGLHLIAQLPTPRLTSLDLPSSPPCFILPPLSMKAIQRTIDLQSPNQSILMLSWQFHATFLSKCLCLHSLDTRLLKQFTNCLKYQTLPHLLSL